MITKSDAIKIGAAVLKAANREKDNNFNRDESNWICNGVSYAALQNIWHDVLTAGTREKFGYSYEFFYDECNTLADSE